MVRRLSVSIVTAADGSAIGYSDHIHNGGLLHQARYVKTDFADTVDFDVTVEDTGEVIWDEDNVTASKTISPRVATHTTAGVAAAYASGGSGVLDKIAVTGRIKVQIANGGDTKSGTFHFMVE